MAASIGVLTKNAFNLLHCFKQQNALQGLVTARCSVLAVRSTQVKFLLFLNLLWASIGRRLPPELWARAISAGLGSALVPWGKASETGSWASMGKAPCVCPQEQFFTLLMKIVPFLSLQKENPEAACSPRKGHRTSSFGAREIPLKQSYHFYCLDW